MPKQSGLGSRFFIGEYDLSGDVNTLGQVSSPISLLPATGINVYAMERMHAHRDGVIAFTTYFNPDTGRAHAGLSGLPTANRVTTFCVGATLGNPAASEVAKQIGYDGTRGQDGSLTLDVQAVANGYGLEWGRQLTAGSRTDTAATNGTGVDFTASTSFGWQAYLNVTAFVGTDVTISIEDSANNSAFSALASGAFTAVTAATSQRLAVSGTATVRRYVRIATSTSGGFTSVTFAVNFIKNEAAVTF